MTPSRGLIVHLFVGRSVSTTKMRAVNVELINLAHKKSVSLLIVLFFCFAISNIDYFFYAEDRTTGSHERTQKVFGNANDALQTRITLH